jgi:hypothetical protein
VRLPQQQSDIKPFSLQKTGLTKKTATVWWYSQSPWYKPHRSSQQTHGVKVFANELCGWWLSTVPDNGLVADVANEARVMNKLHDAERLQLRDNSPVDPVVSNVRPIRFHRHRHKLFSQQSQYSRSVKHQGLGSQASP